MLIFSAQQQLLLLRLPMLLATLWRLIDFTTKLVPPHQAAKMAWRELSLFVSAAYSVGQSLGHEA